MKEGDNEIMDRVSKGHLEVTAAEVKETKLKPFGGKEKREA